MNMKVFNESLSLLLALFSVQTQAAETEVSIARWGTASQSNTYMQTWSARNALDGNPSTCTHTPPETDPWWTLDLLQAFSITRVSVTNRADCCPDRINGAEIRIGNVSTDVFSNTLCAVISSIPAGASYDFSCSNVIVGRYVIVVISGSSRVLTLCEVKVYAIFQVNLAVGKSVTQSSTFSSWIAEQAVDFNPGLINAASACSSTTNETDPWWRVDLRYIYKVSRVVVTNRFDCCPQRINGAQIHVGNSLENNGNNNPMCAVISSIPAGASFTFACNDMEGRYVNLIIPGDSRFLTLCEVEVYGEGPCLTQTLVKLKLQSSVSLTDTAMTGQLLTQLESALAQRGITDVTLGWTQVPKKEVMRRETTSTECPQRKR